MTTASVSSLAAYSRKDVRSERCETRAIAKMNGLCQTFCPRQNALLSPEIQLNGSQGASSLT